MSKSKNGKPKPFRCAIYTRKSTEDGLEQEFNSLDAQREAGEAFIASQKHEGWVALPTRYDDGGFSGGNAERPGLHKLLSDIKAGHVDCVVVYKVDRLSRSLLDFARIMGTFEAQNVSFVSVTQQFNTSHSMGRLTLNILLSFAQFEREIIGERIRDKIAAQRRKGKWAGGIPVLGYDIDRSGPSPKLVVNPVEAPQVKQIYDLYLSLGSLLPVVSELVNRGWRNKSWTTKAGVPKGGNPFDRGMLYSLLTNPIYIAKVKHKNELFDGEHEAIITPEVFHAVQTRLKQNGRTAGIYVRNKYGALLKGILGCKGCGRTMTHTYTNGLNRRYRYYTCTKAIGQGRGSCPSCSLPATEIEAAVVDQVRCIASDAKLRAAVVAEAQSHIKRELEEINTEREHIERDLKWHAAEIRQITMQGNPDDDATSVIADLHDRISKGEKRLTEIKARIQELKAEQLTDDEVATAFADFDGVWSVLSPSEQWQLLGLLISRVEFDAKESTIEVCFHATGIRHLATRNSEEMA